VSLPSASVLAERAPLARQPREFGAERKLGLALPRSVRPRPARAARHGDALLARELPPAGNMFGTGASNAFRTCERGEREALEVLARIAALALAESWCGA
jgi:hypothetical protein